MAKAIIIGGGIIGLSSAWYLRNSGWDVQVLDRGDFSDNCSYGNAGYICPSHFVPLAAPGMVKTGLKWMWNSKSPFYVQPRLSKALLEWGWHFMRSATPAHLERSAVPLRDIALLSQQEYASWSRLPGFNFAFEHKGLLEIFQTEAGLAHARHSYEKALELGLSDTRLLSREEMQALEPDTEINGIGALFFGCDAHCYPNKLMKALQEQLRASGVELLANKEVTGFETKDGVISHLFCGAQSFTADQWVLATGSWSRELATALQLKLPLVPGRGYSLTLEDSPYKVNYPAILHEGRVAITPMDGNKIRFGGTMEITSTRTPPRIRRVEGILKAVKSFYPRFEIPLPAPEQVWYGFRPCSADGLPYIGRSGKWSNLIIATGHAMLGLSLGAGTGKLVSEMVNESPGSIDTKAFRPDRFK